MFLALLHTLFFTANVAYARCDVRASVSLASPTTSVGQSQKVYATIDNPCDEDVEGTAVFLVDGSFLGSKPFSVRAGGRIADTWVTWTPRTAGTATIRVEVNGTLDPSRAGTSAFASTGFLVEIDTDRDGIPDSLDEDDDNDGLTDAQEKALGTDPKQMDTDHDGVDDKRDAFPLDPNKTQIPPPSPPPVITPPSPPMTPSLTKTRTTPSAPKQKIIPQKPVAIPHVEVTTDDRITPLFSAPIESATPSSSTMERTNSEEPAPTIQTPSTTIVEFVPPPTPSSFGATQLLWTIAIVTGIAGASFFALSIKT